MTCKGAPVISGFIGDTFFMPPATVVAGFRTTSFNTVATPLAWSILEKEPDRIDIAPYVAQLDALVRDGFCLLLLMDTGGRGMRTEIARKYIDINTIPTTSQPGWISRFSAAPNSVDFFGNSTQTLDFEDQAARQRVEKLYARVLPLLKQRYGHAIVAVAPCFTEECEVKYSQKGFRWQSYSAQAKQAFSAWLAARQRPAAEMPVMDYPNHLGAGDPKVEPAYPDMQSFREDSLGAYACRLTSLIRGSAFPALGYFGQVFSFTDAIYATGSIEKAAPCFDAVAIDYNFYNGYAVELKPEIPAFLTNYVRDLGYKSVIVGLYAERFRDPTTGVVSPAAYPVIEQALRAIEPGRHVAGVEIGNLDASEFANVKDIAGIVRAMNEVPTRPAPRKKVGVYASLTNFYLWQGDWSNGRQIMQDNLIRTYERLKRDPTLQVDLLGDAALAGMSADALKSYDLLVLPHVTTMPPVVRTKLQAWFAGTGRLLVDMRFDDYLPDGTPQAKADFRHALGIGALQAYPANRVFSDGTTMVRLQKTNHYVNGFVMAAMPGFSAGYRLANRGGEGIVLKGPRSTVFGFLPLFVEGANRAWGEKLFDAEVARLLGS